MIESDWARPRLPGVFASDALSLRSREWHRVSGIPQMWLRWVEFLKSKKMVDLGACTCSSSRL